MLNWLDQIVRFRRRSGAGFDATPLDLTVDYEVDPVVAMEAGHPFIDRGFEFLLRDLIQAALPPRNDRAWTERLLAPPTPDALRKAFEPYNRALVLDDPCYPALQVRPSHERLGELQIRGGDRHNPADRAGDAEGDDEDDEPAGHLLSVAFLLPEEPTVNVLARGEAFFAHGHRVEAISAGLILPVLYAHMVLFPGAGGGYYGLPHGADSIKFQISGRTLWETVWANVLSQDNPRLADAVWPPPCDHRVFPWLDSSLRDMSLMRKHPAATRGVELTHRHPAHIPMPRRYLLDAALQGRCSLTGFEGPVFASFRRWPNGLQYAPASWWFWSCGTRDEFEQIGNGWRLKPKKPGRDGREPGPEFIRTRGPLRFDDWLEASLGYEALEPPPGSRKIWRHQEPPPVLKAFPNRLGELSNLLWERNRVPKAASALTAELPLRVRATAVVIHGKPMVATAERELPLFRLEGEAKEVLPLVVSGVVELLAQMADRLANAARSCIKLGQSERKVHLNRDLRDALLRTLDLEATALPGRLVVAWCDVDPDQRTAVANDYKRELLEGARRKAIELFDSVFPIAALNGMTAVIAKERRELVRDLQKMINRNLPAPASERDNMIRERKAEQ